MDKKMAPPKAVSKRNFWSPLTSPRRIAERAFTIVTLEQMRTKVLNAVSGTSSTEEGTGQSADPMRSAPYAHKRMPKVRASETKNNHMPTLPRTVPVSSGDVSIAITWSIENPLLQDIQNREQHEPNAGHKVPIELGILRPGRFTESDGQDRQPA